MPDILSVQNDNKENINSNTNTTSGGKVNNGRSGAYQQIRDDKEEEHYESNIYQEIHAEDSVAPVAVFIILSVLEIGLILDFLSKPSDIVRTLGCCKSLVIARAITPECMDKLLMEILRGNHRYIYENISAPEPLYSLLDLQDLYNVFSRFRCCYTLTDFNKVYDEIYCSSLDIQDNLYDDELAKQLIHLPKPSLLQEPLHLTGIFCSTDSNIIVSFNCYLSRACNDQTSITLYPTKTLCEKCQFIRCKKCYPVNTCDVCNIDQCILCTITSMCDYCETNICQHCNGDVPLKCCIDCQQLECSECSENISEINSCDECNQQWCQSCRYLKQCALCDVTLCQDCAPSKILSCECVCGCDEERCNSCGGVSKCSNDVCGKMRCANCEMFAVCSNCSIESCSDCFKIFDFTVCLICDDEVCNTCCIYCTDCRSNICEKCYQSHHNTYHND